METLFTSEQGKKEILALYDSKLTELNLEYSTQTISTRFGSTHVIITGNPSNPPLILIHGSNGCAPVALETCPNLSEHFHVFAIDVLAQPNKSEENRLSMKDLSYGKWIHEIISILDLKDVTLSGFSFGGLIILKTLEESCQSIKQAFLICPTYIVNGNPLKALWKVFIPMKRFMKTKDPKFVEKFSEALFTERDAFAIQFLTKVFSYFNMDFSPLPVIKKESANTITTPITIFGADDDIFFPGQKMIKRAQKIFPSLKETVLFYNSKHVQKRSDNKVIEQKIIKCI